MDKQLKVINQINDKCMLFVIKSENKRKRNKNNIV